MGQKKVFVAPLDWGLGHATRCIPVINKLLQLKCEVVMGCSGSPLTVLRDEFPYLKVYELPSYKASYSRRVPFMIWILLQVPKFFMVIQREKTRVRKIHEIEQFDLIISDNRYGCYLKSIPSAFITHQVNILMPGYLKFMEGIINYFNHKGIKKFSRCWIPDLPGSMLTGKLTSGATFKVTYLGVLSRFSYKAIQSCKYDILVLLSGPEPQRTILENILADQLESLDVPKLLIRGLPESKKEEPPWQRNYLNAKELEEVMLASKVVICRSGYSTVMDLAVLGKKAIFIPTPGQTEQEYLAERMKDSRIAQYQHQNKFNLVKALEEMEDYDGFTPTFNSSQLTDVLEKFIQ